MDGEVSVDGPAEPGHSGGQSWGFSPGGSNPHRCERGQRGSMVRPTARHGRFIAQETERPSSIPSDRGHGELTLNLLDETRDRTLFELRDLVAQHGVRTNHATLWRLFRCHGLTLKKRLPTPRSRIDLTS